MLPAAVDKIMFSRLFHISGVIQIHLIIFHQRRTRVHTMKIPRLFRIQHDRTFLPVDQIPALIMSPVFASAFRHKRRILVKHMILALKTTQTIRIIQPANRRHEMIGKTPVIHACRLLCFLFKLFYFFCPVFFFLIVRRKIFLCSHNNAVFPFLLTSTHDSFQTGTNRQIISFSFCNLSMNNIFRMLLFKIDRWLFP